MKRIMLFTLLLFILLCLGAIIWTHREVDTNSKYEVGVFDIDYYEDDIKKFSSNIMVNPIESDKDAIETAKMIWKEKFPQYKEKNVGIDYDAQADCWHIYGTLQPVNDIFGIERPRLGGVPHLLVLSSGQVLAVWGTQ